MVPYYGIRDDATTEDSDYTDEDTDEDNAIAQEDETDYKNRRHHW